MRNLMVSAFGVLMVLLFIAAVHAGDSLNHDETVGYVIYSPSSNASDQWEYTDVSPFKRIDKTTQHVAAMIHYTKGLEKDGWDRIAISTNQSFIETFGQRKAFYAAGLLEGIVTRSRIRDHRLNMIEKYDKGLQSPAFQQFVNRQRQWMEDFSNDKHGPQGLHGQIVGGILDQVKGITDGYNQGQASDEHVSEMDIYLMSFDEEISDVLQAVEPEMSDDERMDSPRHCSALIKITKDDLFFGHDTWTGYETMSRQHKTYNFGTGLESVTMSSYPGAVHSIDDFYMTSAKLAVMETSLGVYNTELYKNVKTETIAEFVRVMFANYVSTRSQDWVASYSLYNSGTYNNQWMVMDMKKVKKTAEGMHLDAFAFYVSEQLPGTITSADKTATLVHDKYWASYNLPSFPSVTKLSGTQKMIDEFGDFYNNKKYARSVIFARDQGNVKDLKSMKSMMRYNDFQHDPLSRITNCNHTNHSVCTPAYSAMLTIAARGDLNPPGGESEYGPNYRFLNQRDHGATDTKITSWSMMMDDASANGAVFINGPTNVQQPVFDWKHAPAVVSSKRHVGLPERYTFDFVEFATTHSLSTAPDSKKQALSTKYKIIIAVCVCVGFVAIIAIVVSMKKASRHSEYVETTTTDDRLLV